MRAYSYIGSNDPLHTESLGGGGRGEGPWMLDYCILWGWF